MRTMPLPHQGPRLRTGPRADDSEDGGRRVRGPAADDRLVQARRADPTTRPTSRRRRTPAIRTTIRPGTSTAHRPNESAAARPLGEAAGRPARCLLTSPGSASPAAACPTNTRAAFAAARDGRDAAIALVQSAHAPARAPRLRGGPRVPRRHRAGRLRRAVHSPHRAQPGRNVHGNGVHMDDYETHDDRRLIPGHRLHDRARRLYDRFGVRTEINMFMGERDALVTGPLQTEIVTLDSRTGRRRQRRWRHGGNVHAEDHAVLRCSHRGRFGGGRHGDRLASRPVAGVVGADGQRAGREQRAAERPDRRDDVPQHREGPEPDRRQHPTTARIAAREMTEFFGGNDDLLQRFFGAGAARAAAARPRRPTRSRQEGAGTGFIIDKEPASSSPTITSSRAPTRSGQPLRRRTDREQLPAKVIGRDALTDSALIQLTTEMPSALCRKPSSATPSRCSRATGSWRSAIRSASATPSPSA